MASDRHNPELGSNGPSRPRHRLSLAESAAALGMTTRTVSAYGSGERPVPRYIVLACKGWEAERQAARPQRARRRSMAAA